MDLRSIAPASLPASAGRAAETQASNPQTKASGGCGMGSSRGYGNRKWLLIASAALAIAGAVLGSIWFGFAAVLPLLYLAPCLAMLAMCMRRGGGARPEQQ